jgi:hypothetical protein
MNPIMTQRRTVAVAVGAATFLVAFALLVRVKPVRAETAPPGPSADVRAALIDKRAPKLDHMKGELSLGTDLARYHSILEQGTVLRVEEQLSAGTKASRVNRYYYENGAPFLYRGEALAAATVPAGPRASAATAPVVIEWNGQGIAVRATRTEHWGEVKLDAQAIQAVRSRALLLGTLSATKWLAAHPAPAAAAADPTSPH